MIHSNVRYLPGLLLLVVLAIHSAVNHQTTWANCGKWGILEKDFQWASKCSSLVVCGLGRVEKNWICKIRCWLDSVTVSGTIVRRAGLSKKGGLAYEHTDRDNISTGPTWAKTNMAVQRQTKNRMIKRNQCCRKGWIHNQFWYCF